MIISVGGSVSTGSSPWIDIISAYEDVKVLEKELRIGESGLYTIASKIYMQETPTKDEFTQLKKSLTEFGRHVPLTHKFACASLKRLPGISADAKNRITEYRLRRRSYDKCLPGFSLYSKRMLKELKILIKELNNLEETTKKLKIEGLMNNYLSSLKGCVDNDKKIVFNQLVAPKLLFNKKFGCVLSNILSGVKIVVVRRDPRDQFIDLLLKRKKGYHLIPPSEAASCFVNEYIPRYDRMADMLKECSHSNIIDLWFEDIFFDFETKLKKVESFLGLKSRPNYFDSFDFPDAAGKVKMHEDERYSTEVEFIKDRMKRHLYRY